MKISEWNSFVKTARTAFTSIAVGSSIFWMIGCGGGGEGNSATDSGDAAGMESDTVGVADGAESGMAMNTGGPGISGGAGSVDDTMDDEMSGGSDHGAEDSGDGMMSEDDQMLNGNGQMGQGYPGMQSASGYGGQAPAAANLNPPRPASTSKWTDDDFRNAVKERDEIVIAAIKQKVQSAPGDAAVAKLLTSLLAAALEAPRQSANNGDYNGEYGDGDEYSSNPNGMPGPAGMPGMGGDSSQMMGNPGAGYPGMGPATGSNPGSLSSPGGPGGRPGLSAGPGGGASAPGSSGGSSSAPPTSSLWGSPKANPVFELPRAIQLAASGSSALFYSVTPVLLNSSSGILSYAQVGGNGQSGSGISGRPPLSASGGGGGTGVTGRPPLSASGGGGTGVTGRPPLSASGGGGTGAPGATQGQGNSLQMPGNYGGENPLQQGGGISAPIGSLTDRQLVEAVVEGLLENNSPEAWSTIHGILTDQVKSPLKPEESCELVVEQLFQRLSDSSTNVKLTLTAIVNGSAPLPSANRSAALRTIAAVSAEVADTVLGIPANARQSAAAAGSFAGSSYPGGLSGPGGIPGNAGMPGSGLGGDMPGGDMPGGDMPGGDFGRGAPGGLGGLGGAPPVVVSGPPLRRIALEGAALQQAALFLWGPEMITVISDQLQAASDPDSAAAMVTLAACIPNETIRHALYEAFMRWHAAGANGLMATGLFDHNCHDPGILLVLKGLPRPRPARNGAAPTPDSWAIASSQAVINLRDRLRKAASTLPRFEGNSPLRLHRDAVAEVSIAMTMPGEFGAVLGTAAPAKTRVFYTKTTFMPTSVKEQTQVAEHYESRSSGIRRADPQRGLLWMDGAKTDASGVRRTMDVLIQQAGQGGGAPGGGGFGGDQGGGGTSFSIEVIVVESADPKDSAPTVSSVGGQ